jgi:Putative MetA-pathway of phenol degradation
LRPCLISLVFLLGNSQLNAQYMDVIQSSRPGATDVPFTAGKGVFQLETGILLNDLKNRSEKSDRMGINYTLLSKYGLFEKLEFRTGLIWRAERISENGQDNNLGGLAFWNMGIRVNVLNGAGNSPSLGFETDIRFPYIGAPEYQIEEVAPRFLLLFSSPLIGDISFSSNLGIVWSEIGQDPFSAYTINLSSPISQKTSVFVEAFGNIFLKREGFNLDGGIAYLANKNLQLDLSAAILGVAGDSQGWWVDAGVSWRVDLRGGQ